MVDKIGHMNESLRVYNILNKRFPERVNKVLTQDQCDIEPGFLGFMETYRHLAKIVPKHFRIVDIGCAYGFQSYYFMGHSSYLGVDVGLKETFGIGRFEFLNIRSIPDFLNHFNPLNTDFCICNYVPANELDLIRLRIVFKNLYMFYPEPDPKEQKRISNIMSKLSRREPS